MIKVIISGYYGFNNMGDEAILAAIVTGVKQVLPRPDIVVLSANPAQTADEYGVRAINRANAVQIWREFKGASLFISGGGSLLQDVTGGLTIPYYLGLIQLAKQRKVPVMMFSQGVGPVKGVIGHSLIPLVLKNVNALTVRDEHSQQLLESLGVQGVQLTADPVFFLFAEGEEKVTEIVIKERIPFNEKCPWIGVSLRPWSNEDIYTRVVAQALDRLIKNFNARVLFLPFHQGQDRETIEKTRIRMKNFDRTNVLESSCRPRELLGIMNMLDVLIGMRLHSLVFAARQGIVPVGISYDPKIDALMQRIGREAVGTTAKLSADALVKEVTEVLYMTQEQKQQFQSKTEELEGLAWQAIRQAKDLVIGEWKK